MRWAGHVARVGQSRGFYNDLVVSLTEREHLEDSGIYGRMILRGNFKTWDLGVWIGSIWLGIGTGGGHS
jgi:hypothetical protein